MSPRPKLKPLTFDETFGALARAGGIPLAPYLQLKALSSPKFGTSGLRRQLIDATACYLRRQWSPLPAIRSPWLRELAVSFVEEIERANSVRIEVLMLRITFSAIGPADWQVMIKNIKEDIKEGLRKKKIAKKLSRKQKIRIQNIKLRARGAARENKANLLFLIEGLTRGWFPGVTPPSAGLLPAVATAAVAETNPLIVAKKSRFCEWCCAYHV